MNKLDQVVSLIERNRISTAQVSDALGKAGVLNNFKALTRGYHKVGKVNYIYTHSGSNYDLHKQIQFVEEDSIVFIEGFDCDGKALLGELVAKYLLLYKKCKALIVSGLVRDAHSLVKEKYPIWSFGTTPLGCVNSPVQLTPSLEKNISLSQTKFEDGIIIADDSGVVLIEKEMTSADLIKKLEFMELQEDIWFYCIDTLKWSTYETICQKSYMKDTSLLPLILRRKLEEVDFYESK
jgi:regulator of RNase E activity RraA